MYTSTQDKKDKFSWNKCFGGWLFQSEEKKTCFGRKAQSWASLVQESKSRDLAGFEDKQRAEAIFKVKKEHVGVPGYE